MIIVLRGAQGSGKSVFTKQFHDSLIVSSDKLREVYAGSMYDQRISSLVFKRLHEIVDSRASHGVVTVVDATNTRPKSIIPFQEIAKKYGVPLHVVNFELYDVDILMERIKTRYESDDGMYVPRSVVERTVNTLQNSNKQIKEMVGEECFHVYNDELTAEYFDNFNHKNIIEVNENFWAIGDIHGCYKTMKALVENLVNEKGAEHIVFCGDFVDRGPDNIGVITYLEYLLNGAYEDIKFYAVRGNHDQALYNKLKHGHEVRSEARKKTHEEINNYLEPELMKEIFIDVIERLPQHITFQYYEQLYLVTHAGLNIFPDDTTFRNCGSCNINKQLSEDEHEYLYGVLKDIGIKQIHGHRDWEFKLPIDPVISNIDKGCVYGKGLLAYNPIEQEVLIQETIDETDYIDSEFAKKLEGKN